MKRDKPLMKRKCHHFDETDNFWCSWCWEFNQNDICLSVIPIMMTSYYENIFCISNSLCGNPLDTDGLPSQRVINVALNPVRLFIFMYMSLEHIPKDQMSYIAFRATHMFASSISFGNLRMSKAMRSIDSTMVLPGEGQISIHQNWGYVVNKFQNHVSNRHVTNHVSLHLKPPWTVVGLEIVHVEILGPSPYLILIKMNLYVTYKDLTRMQLTWWGQPANLYI